MENEDTQFESIDAVKRAFNFLMEKYNSPETFTKEEFKTYANYPNPNNFGTYFSKKFRHLLEKSVNEENEYLVAKIFRKYSTYDKFFSYYSQSSKIKAEYSEESFDDVIIFEFFMPLTNEAELRSTLDELFFKDTIKLMFNRILNEDLYRIFPKKSEESEDYYIERLCNWISDRFVGYSIQTVSGRFKITDLKTYSEVSEILGRGQKYLIDETTAIVRFLFPIGKPIKNEIIFGVDQFVTSQTEELEERNSNIEASQIRFFFKNLFVRNILEMVNGEDEIWMLESGMRNKLYIWEKKN